MTYSGSILNPQASPQANQQRAYNSSANQQRPYQPVSPPKPAAFSPPRPAMYSSTGGAAPAPPSVYSPPPQASPAFSPSPLSPPIKQGAPAPWVPADGSGKVKELQCGDTTAHRGTTTYYNAAPLDPGKVPICNNCHTSIRRVK